MNRLLEKIKNKNTPQVVPIKIEEYSTADSCFYNVLDKISIDNGEIVYGWKLHQSEFLAEAERHAVWKSSTGELIDITPDLTNQQNILFLQEDNGWRYDGKYSGNIIINLTDNLLVDDYILLSETISKLWQTGIRKSRMEIELFEPIYKLINFLEEDKIKRKMFIKAGNTINSNCFCGNNALYKECHGLQLDKIYEGILNKISKLIKNQLLTKDKKIRVKRQAHSWCFLTKSALVINVYKWKINTIRLYLRCHQFEK